MTRYTALLLATAATLVGHPAFAKAPTPSADEAGTAQSSASPQSDTSSASVPGDIVVTATRREVSQSKVPISITAYSQKSLDTQGIKSIRDLAVSTPGITLTQGWGASTNIAIRGIYSATGASTTGIYLDDVPIQTRRLGASGTFTNAYPALFDLDHVEVLKGPQGTLFGAGSEGGTIRFISVAPSLTTYSGYTHAEAGFTDGGAPSYEIGTALGGPILKDALGFRLSVYQRHDGGYIDRDPYPTGTVAKNSNYTNTTSVHGALLAKIGDNLTITPSVFWQKQYRNDSNAYWANLSNPGAGSYVSGQPLAQPESDIYGLYSLKVEYDLGFANLVSNTSYLSRRDHAIADYSNFGAELLGLDYRAGVDLGLTSPTYTDNTQHSFTQETRLQSNGGPDSRLSWTVGVFYQNSRQTADELVTAPGYDTLTQAYFGTDTAGVLGSSLLPGNVSYHGYATSRDRQIAGFGQVDWKILPTLTMTVGGRVARTLFNSTEVANGPLNGGLSTSSAYAKQTPFTPKFGLSYLPTREWMVYASAAKGFREGGGNNKVAATDLCNAGLALLGLTAAPTSYNSDSVWSYEAGVKGDTLHKRVQVSASAFQINWSGIQNGVNLNCGQGFTANLGNARSRGLEAQATIKPITGFSLSGSLAYTDARYTSSVTATGTSYITQQGQQLAVPPWAVQVSGDYELADIHHYRPYLHADYNYASAYTFSLASTTGYDPSYFRQTSTHYVNLRMGLRRDQLDLSIFAQNLFNSTDLLNVHHDLTSSALFRNMVNRPRTIGMSASYRY